MTGMTSSYRCQRELEVLKNFGSGKKELEDSLMARKPTYEELEQRVKELEAEADRHRQVEKKLQESEARFRAFMDNNPAVAYIKNESGQHLYGNKTLFDKFDFPPDKFIGSTTRDFFPRAEAEKIEAYDEMVKTEGVPLETDDWSDKWQGQVRWWKEIKFPIKSPSGDMLIGGIAFDITERKEVEKALQESQENLQRLAGELISTQEAERCLLAREMHDDISQRLAILAIDAAKLEGLCEDSTNPIVEELQDMRERLVDLSSDIHDISRQLHPSILDDLGLVDAVQAECDVFTSREGITVKYETKRLPSKLPKDIALALFRIVQEGLRNVAKHAQTHNVKVVLFGKDDLVHLNISDDGVGFDYSEARKKPGLGLASMEERVRLIQGDLSIQSQPGKGTVIEVRAPMTSS
jgi:PAS domain S-box-containing protein